MKKILIVVVLIALSFAIIACGPNYTGELNIAVDKTNVLLNDYDALLNILKLAIRS